MKHNGQPQSELPGIPEAWKHVIDNKFPAPLRKYVYDLEGQVHGVFKSMTGQTATIGEGVQSQIEGEVAGPAADDQEAKKGPLGRMLEKAAMALLNTPAGQKMVAAIEESVNAHPDVRKP